MKLIIIFLALFLTACVSSPTTIPKNFSLKPTSNTGLIVFSTVNKFDVKPDGVAYDVNLKIQNTDTKETTSVKTLAVLMTPSEGMISYADKKDFNDNPYGVLVIKNIPAGNYSITLPHPGYMFMKYMAQTKTSKFVVRPNEITYLGEYGINVSANEISNEHPPEAYIRDARKRDINFLKQNYPNLAELKVNHSVYTLNKTPVMGWAVKPPTYITTYTLPVRK